MNFKTCSHCKIEKNIINFYKDKSRVDGLFPWCKECFNKHKSEKYLNRKEKILKYQKNYHNKNKERILKHQREYYDKFPWIKTYLDIIQRCTNPNNPKYKSYKNRLGDITKEDLKEIWFRDKAYLMEHPSIDRIDNNLPYTKDNCQYLEVSYHNQKTYLEQKSLHCKRG